jgi:hypothetical protein
MGDISKGVAITLVGQKIYIKYLTFSMYDNVLSFLSNKYPFVSKHGVF